MSPVMSTFAHVAQPTTAHVAQPTTAHGFCPLCDRCNAYFAQPTTAHVAQPTTTSIPVHEIITKHGFPHTLVQNYPELQEFLEYWFTRECDNTDAAKRTLATFIAYKAKDVDYNHGSLRSSGLSSTWCCAALYVGILLDEDDVEYAKTRGGMWSSSSSLLDVLS